MCQAEQIALTVAIPLLILEHLIRQIVFFPIIEPGGNGTTIGTSPASKLFGIGDEVQEVRAGPGYLWQHRERILANLLIIGSSTPCQRKQSRVVGSSLSSL